MAGGLKHPNKMMISRQFSSAALKRGNPTLAVTAIDAALSPPGNARSQVFFLAEGCK